MIRLLLNQFLDISDRKVSIPCLCHMLWYYESKIQKFLIFLRDRCRMCKPLV
jgi:hypothetical protein